MAAPAGATILGLDSLKANLSKYQVAVIQKTGNALGACGEAVMRKAGPYTPRETGNLRRSAAVGGIVWESPTYMYVELMYNADYAWYVHEMTYATNWTTAGTGAKFLERALYEMQPKLAKMMGDMLSGGISYEAASTTMNMPGVDF